MASKKINFTKATLKAIKAPFKPEHRKGSVYDTYHDTKEKGLILIITNNGNKTFYWYGKIDGKPERVRIGNAQDITIENARKAAVDIRSKINTGKNPNKQKNKLKQEMTLKQLFDIYMERYSKPSKKSWQYDEREIPKFFGQWFHRKISSLKKDEIIEWFYATKNNNGTIQANRALERIRSMYNRAIEWGWEGQNPTVGIKKFKEKSRERFIQPYELPYLFQAIELEESQTAKDFFILSLMTGARKANMLAMRWDQINLDQQQWIIPETKNGESLIVPLVEKAISILERRHSATNSPWVFPSSQKAAHFSDPKKAWDRIRKRATLELWKENPELSKIISEIETKLNEQNNYGYTIVKLYNEAQKYIEANNIEAPIGLMDIRIHDIRRTFGSYQAITGANTQIIGRSLGHKSQQATQIYSRLHLDPVRASMEKATNEIFRLQSDNRFHED